MDISATTYSQSLRAIGQALQALNVGTFILEKEGNDYLVRVRAPAEQESARRPFPRNLVEKIWGPLPSQPQPLPTSAPIDLLRYTSQDIERLEGEGRSRRSNADGMPDSHSISQGLRVIGNYVTQKRGQLLAISWFGPSVSITYEVTGGRLQHERIGLDSLYDLWVHMYKRRSTRIA